jgi:cyclic pyranopterin monophosphate synthase
LTSKSRDEWPGGKAAGVSPSRKERRRLTHVDRTGRPRMVDVSEKPTTARRAVAEATVKMDQETLTLVIDGQGPKGDVLSVAELAGIMAAKRTAELIPLCHPLPLSDVGVEITPDRKAGTLVITATAATTAQTGVEMEAMTAASIAALTVYDMVKAADRFVTVTNVRLLEKSGGASGNWRRPAPKGSAGAGDEGAAAASASAATRPARKPSSPGRKPSGRARPPKRS